MAYWKYREELSQVEKLRRSYYELLRDELDQFLLQYALIDSYHNFISHQKRFPFVEKRELKPRGRIPDQESLIAQSALGNRSIMLQLEKVHGRFTISEARNKSAYLYTRMQVIDW